MLVTDDVDVAVIFTSVSVIGLVASVIADCCDKCCHGNLTKVLARIGVALRTDGVFDLQ